MSMYFIDDKVAAIKEIQRLLGVSRSGNFDAKTREAVKTHQMLNGIEPTGIVDYNTFISISANHKLRTGKQKIEKCVPLVTRFPYQIGYSGDDVTMINSLLSNAVEKYELNYIKPRGKYYSVRTAGVVRRLREIFLLEDGYHVDSLFFELLLKQ